MFILKNTVSFTGHRPDKLGNAYGFKHPVIIKLKAKLLEVIEKLIVEEGVDTFITGGALGVDTVAYFCVQILKKKYPHIKNIVAVPFANQNANWKKKECNFCTCNNCEKLDCDNCPRIKCRKCTYNATNYWYQKMLKTADEIYYVDTVEGYNKDRKVEVGVFSNYKMQLRNMFMVDNSNYVVAVWDGIEDGGTYNCVKYAKDKKKTIYHLNVKKNFELNIVTT